MIKLLIGLLSVMLVASLLRRMAEGLARARVARRHPARPQGFRRLRQDPRTGIYYPEG